MKKILILFISIVLPLISSAQLIGTGSFGDPFSGTFEGDLQWNSTNFTNGKVFIEGDVIIDDEELVIGAGMKIIFVVEGSDLIVRGTGQLTADGTPSGMITFTSDDNNNDAYGESGERWGHISFQSFNGGFTGASLMDNCVIEYGQKNSDPFGVEACGGGLYINYSYLTLSNTIVQNNYAGFGGGIFVTQSSPSIVKCTVKNNTAGTGAGGIYFYSACPSNVENSLIHNNTSSGPGGGGGIFAGFEVGNLQLINCVIASNVSTWGYGDNLRLYSNTSASVYKLQNCIIWGSDSWIDYVNSPVVTTSIINCAVQGNANIYTNCINISSNNSIGGPYFVDPNNGDYSITVFSPCRDAGSTPSTPIPQDFFGNSRIGAYDIGVYEVQYNGWKTTAANYDWSDGSNWDLGAPTSLQDVVIRSGASKYPTSSISQSFIIGSGKGLVLDPGSKATLGTLTNNGELKLRYDITDTTSLFLNSSGITATIETVLEGGGKKTPPTYKWHYISTPFATVNTSVFTAVTPDLAQFVESRPATDPVEGWVASDGYIYSTGGTGTGFSTLDLGRAYNYFDYENRSYTFSGTINTGDVVATLNYTNTAPLTYKGYNLIGNPFTSGLDWDYIITNSFPANTSKALYVTRFNVWSTYINGVGVPADVSGIIPPLQGFMVKTSNIGGTTLTLPAAARVNYKIHPRYKGSSIIPLVRLAISKDDVEYDQTVLRFDDLAKSTLDNDFDASKIFLSVKQNSIYTSSTGTNYAINGQPFPETILEMPVVVNVTSDSTYKISNIQLQGLENYNVYLIDNLTGYTANLKTTPEVLFTSTAGTIADRFILRVSTILTSIEEPTISNSLFNIYIGNNLINVQTISDGWDGKTGSVKILDLNGKITIDSQNAEFTKNSILQLQSPKSKGLYIVEIRSGVKRWVGKVVIR